MAIKDRIREARQRKNLTQEQLASQIGIAKSTLAGYETGIREPSIEIIGKIMMVLDIDANYLWQDEGNFPLQVSYNEMEHIKKYRSLDPHSQSHIDSLLDWEVEHSSQLRQSQERITKLEGQNATIIDLPPRSSTYTRLAKYYRSASAGSGVFILGNESTEKISLPATPENEIVDYVIRVSGNSMEPVYHDGDNVMVSQRLEMQHGDVGIFVVNGNAYIKEYGETELISRNPDSPNIKIAEYDNIVCMGKVVGRLEGLYEIISN